MGELGNVFDALDRGSDAPGAARGRDLRAEVRIDPRQLGAPQGQRVQVPMELEVDGESVPRSAHPGDEPGFIELHLPEGFPDGGGLKLRGQGEPGNHGGPPGDLILQVRHQAGAGGWPTALAPLGERGLAGRPATAWAPWVVGVGLLVLLLLTLL